MFCLTLPLWLACDKNEEPAPQPGDYGSQYFRFEVSDPYDESDLLNPESSDFVRNPIQILYNGKSYPMTPATEEQPKGITLLLHPAPSEGEFCYLTFGPFDYMDNLRNQRFTIDWSTSEDEVLFDCGWDEWTGRTGIPIYSMRINGEEKSGSWRHRFTKSRPVYDFTN